MDDIYTLAESLNAYSAGDAVNDLLRVLPESGGRLIVDASRTQVVDSAGIQVMLSLVKESDLRNVVLIIHQPTDRLKQMLQLMGIHKRFCFDMTEHLHE